MTLAERIERAIARNGSTIAYTPLKGLKAVTIKANGKYAIFADRGDLNTMSALASAEAHEYGHVATGSVYDFDTDELTLLKAEHKADRYAAHRFLPVRKIKKAMLSGYTEAWQLAEYFDFDERFIRTALYVYQIEGLYADLQSGRSEGRPSEV
jgi:hypothetical protein